MQNISIILVQPQLGENIGAAARAMKNFNLSDLRIVDPRDGWPNEKADSMSVGAIDLIKNAKIFSNLNEAIKDLNYIYAATAQKRDMNKDYLLSRDLKLDINNKGNVGILFGREATGLTNEEIMLANKIITINTRHDFSSLNIAHAVCIIAYELFQHDILVRKDLQNTQQLATQADVEHLHQHLMDVLIAKNFFKTDEKKEQMGMKIRNLLARIDKLSISDVQILRGVLKTQL